MKKTYVIGNWKSNKTITQAENWLYQFSSEFKVLPATATPKALQAGQSSELENIEIVICPAYIHLSLFHDAIKKHTLPIKLGVQDVSPFEEGAYTGAIAASTISNLATHVIIGHSERRKHFGEDDDILKKKVTQARNAGLTIIYCVQDDKTPVPDGVSIVAYEPVWAIGTGKADSPENANSVCKTIREKTGAESIIYGGSVTSENVAAFTATEHIDGVLPGGASLDPEKLLGIIHNAKSDN